MGWDSMSVGHRLSNEEVRAEIESVWTRPDGVVVRCKFPVIRSNVAFGVGYENDEPKCILVYLLSRTRHEFGYKAMDETVGPNEVSCPLYLLDLVPVPAGEYAAPWRGRVRAYHAAAAKQRKLAKVQLVSGQRIVDKFGRSATVHSVRHVMSRIGRRTKTVITVFYDGSSTLYRLPQSWLKEVIEIPLVGVEEK